MFLRNLSYTSKFYSTRSFLIASSNSTKLHFYARLEFCTRGCLLYKMFFLMARNGKHSYFFPACYWAKYILGDDREIWRGADDDWGIPRSGAVIWLVLRASLAKLFCWLLLKVKRWIVSMFLNFDGLRFGSIWEMWYVCISLRFVACQIVQLIVMDYRYKFSFWLFEIVMWVNLGLYFCFHRTSN